tara:strand:+ start:1830 stop:3119 length:1290 start_codon:yes stop_codon:yes gene_type:complete
MAIKNQGYKRDSNLVETENEAVALNNIGGAGISDDIRLIQNNLRNVSKLGFTTVSDTVVNTSAYFTWENGRDVGITSLSATRVQIGTQPIQSTIYIILDNPHYIDNYDQIELKNVTGTGNTFFNGYHFVDAIFDNNGQYVIDLPAGYDIGEDSISMSLDGSEVLKIRPKQGLKFTKDDIVGISTPVSIGSTTLKVGTNYYACDSDGETKFKLSYYPSDYVSIDGTQVGIQTINLTATEDPTPNYFEFLRSDPVSQTNLINYIKPEISDEGGFDFFRTPEEDGGSFTINQVFQGITTNHSNARYAITKKYKGTGDVTSSRDIKYEGYVKVIDPDPYNQVAGNLDDSASPGVFIAGTRAFSSDNNPWTDTISNKLTTESEQPSMGELSFHDNIRIDNIDVETQANMNVNDYTHKIPIVINGQTYYLLTIAS